MIGSLIAGLGGAAFAAIGTGALLAPGFSSLQYGLPTTERTALALVRAIGARDVVLGVIVVALVAKQDRPALELVLITSVLAAAGDALAVTTGRSDAGPKHLAVHAIGAAALVIAWALVRSGR